MEFALVLPLFVACVAVLFAILSACLTSLSLHDTARNAARVAITADNIETALSEFLQQSSVKATFTENVSTGIISVTAQQPLQLWLLNVPIGIFTLQATSSMMREPPLVLG